MSGTFEGAGGIGGLLARTDATQAGLLSTAFYHADGNGNITALVSTNGLIVARYHYDPYANTLAASGPLAEANLYRFSSKEWHANAGLYYYGYRFYEPNLQRWLNRDPIEEAGGINLYGFVSNAPIGLFDPLGFQEGSKCDCVTLRAQIDLLYKQFNEGSDALRNQLNFQYDTLATLYWVDRAVDTASGVTGGAVGSAVKGAVLARATATAGGTLAGQLVRSGVLRPGTITLTGKVVDAAEGWMAYGIYGTVSGGAAKQAITIPLKVGTGEVRDQMQDTADSMNAYLNDLSKRLADLRLQYEISCEGK